MTTRTQITLFDPDGNKCCRGSWGERGLVYIVWENGSYKIVNEPAEGATAILAMVWRFFGTALVCIDQNCSVKTGERAVVRVRDVDLLIGLKPFMLQIRSVINARAILNNFVSNRRLHRVALIAFAGIVLAASLFASAPVDPVTIALQVAQKWKLTGPGM